MSRSPSALEQRSRWVAQSPGQRDRAVAAADLVKACIRGIQAIDESDKSDWHVIISLALSAGLAKERLAEAFSCNLMTINRWKAGQNAPGPMARRAIKAELVSLLTALAKSYAEGEVEPHLISTT